MTLNSSQEERLSALIGPAFFSLHCDIRAGNHTHYWLRGGRGSGKSSFVSIEILLEMMRNPLANAVVYRKTYASLRNSVLPQLMWAAEKLKVRPYWRVQLSTLSLEFLPTGQQILLRGLDTPEKSKSLKPRKGYFALVWFEEAAQLSGMEEIRSVLQSLLRGGERFICFYSYNPPKSQRSWINAYTRSNPQDTVIHESDYRQMPKEWLGPAFIREAQFLKKSNPQLYEHEYLGKVTGLGTEVFKNLRSQTISDEDISKFPSLYRGLDFGYATDPSHYTVCYYDATRKHLYIFFELHLVHASNALLAKEIYREMCAHGRGPVCCDSADPKSIDDLRLLGVAAYGATKGAGSVAWGMKFLSEEVEEIIIDPMRCPFTQREFYEYTLDCDHHGDVIARYPDRNNHSIDAVRYALETSIRARYAGRKEYL